jgi:hypothetical protein
MMKTVRAMLPLHPGFQGVDQGRLKFSLDIAAIFAGQMAPNFLYITIDKFHCLLLTFK